MDTKYGRIFTAKDVAAIIDRLTAGTLEATPEEVVEQMASEVTTTFPADEPLFVLRAQDALGIEVIEAYIEEAYRADTDPENQASARVALDAFAQFFAEHPERVKQPT